MKRSLLISLFVASSFLALAGVSAWAFSDHLPSVFRDSPSMSEAEVLDTFQQELLYVPLPSSSGFEKVSGQEVAASVAKLLMKATLTDALIEAQEEARPADIETIDWDGPLPLYRSTFKRLATYDGDGWWVIGFKDYTWRLNENTKEIVPVSAAAQEFSAKINPPPLTQPDTFEYRISSLIGQADNMLSDLAIMDIRFTQIAAKRPRARPVASYLLTTEELRRSLTGDPNDPFRLARQELDLLTAQATDLRWQLGEIDRSSPAADIREFVSKVNNLDALQQLVNSLQKEVDELWIRIGDLQVVIESP